MTWKHCSLRAPELSATLMMDRSWIMLLGLGDFLGGLDDAHQPPALGLGQRPRAHDLDQVPGFRGVGLVVHGELAALADDLLVELVADQARDGDDARLVHLVRDHDPLEGLALVALLDLGLRGLWGRFGLSLLGHLISPETRRVFRPATFSGG